MNPPNPPNPYVMNVETRVPRMPVEHRDAIDRHIRSVLRASAEAEETAAREWLTDTAHAGVRAMLALAGEDPDRSGLVDTPRRVVAAFLDMCDRPGDPATLLARVFDDVGAVDDPVQVGPIPLTSVCEHHLLPFTGRAWIAYLPAPGRVVGLSKLPRLVTHYAHRPQVQERLTRQIRDAIVHHLDPDGVAVKVEASHACTELRGARSTGTGMVTTAWAGVLARDPHRREFLAWTERM